MQITQQEKHHQMGSSSKNNPKNPKTHISLNKPVKVLNKLNKMVLTVGQGENESKVGEILSTVDHNLSRQKFTIFETANESEMYFIECLDYKSVISATNKWGDKEYSHVKAEHYGGHENQMWRFVPYDEMMEKDEKDFKPDFTLGMGMVKMMGGDENKGKVKGNIEETNEKVGSCSATSALVSYSESEEPEKQSKLKKYNPLNYFQKSNISDDNTKPILKLGYDFPSGSDIDTVSHKELAQLQEQQYNQQVNSTNEEKIVSSKSDNCNIPGTSFPEISKTNPYRLGYDFPSGNNINAYTPPEKVIGYEYQHKAESKPQEIFPTNNRVPIRFPVKRKKNLNPEDLDTDGWFFIESCKENMVLEIEGGIDENGMNIVMNKCNGNRNQLWRVV